jgi:nucleotide-binding universal stress UspA family protein
MKTILVTVSGTGTDDAVLDAVYAVAKPLNAHLDFVHMPLTAIDPSDYNPHIEFARGNGLEVALRDTLLNAEDALTMARTRITDYCAKKNILRVSSPRAMGRVTASWTSSPIARGIEGLVRLARTHDLAVVGRSVGERSWSKSLLEALATESGRPVLIVPPQAREARLDTTAVWWKDHSAAARALTAALPLLRVTSKVVLISVLENANSGPDTVSDLAEQLGWYDIDATAEILDQGRRSAIDVLWSASLTHGADLIVMGGFSRSKLREAIFGGCTQSVLDDGVRPVFMLH